MEDVETMEGHEAIVEVLRPALPRLTDDVLEHVVEAVPPLAEWHSGPRDLRFVVEQALGGLIELLEMAGPSAVPPRREIFFDVGRGEMRAGRTTAPVMAAYLVGAQATWRWIARAGHAAGLEPRLLYALAEVIFGYMDRVCATTIEGFSYERSLATTERLDARRRLVALLVGSFDLVRDEVAVAAAAAGWRVPAQVAVVAFGGERTASVAARLPMDAAVARVEEMGWAIVPDPDGPGRRAALLRGLEGIRAGIGPAAIPTAAATSARLADAALRLAGTHADPGPVLADERRVDLMLAADPAVTARLVEDALAPLDLLPAVAAQRLAETLAAWLAHQGEVRPVAAELHVHTQTVRYRLAQLRELLGDRMSRPEGRLELELALRARRPTAPGPVAQAAVSR